MKGLQSGKRWGALFRGEHHYSLDDKMSASQSTRPRSGRRTRKSSGAWRLAGAILSGSSWRVPKTSTSTGKDD